MARFTALLVLAAALLLAGAQAHARMEGRTGHAHDPRTGALIYIEHHEQTLDGDRVVAERVTYRDPAGEVIAIKELDYRPGLFLPDFRMENFRTGHVEGGRRDGSDYIVSFRSRSGQALKEERVAIPADAVADAGFDQLVVAHWESLRRGETLVRDFLIPGMKRFVRFRLFLRDPQDTLGGDIGRQLVVEPASAALRWFADPLLLVYDDEPGGGPRLRQFLGISNLRDADGDNHVVRIEFGAGAEEVARR